MATFHDSKENLHLAFVYCDYHDQGAVAIFTDQEWLEIDFINYNTRIFKYVGTMCDFRTTDCAWSWRCCGSLEYNSLSGTLEGQETVKTNFEREGGGWEFEYFKNELYTSKGKIDVYDLPRAVREYLSHLNVPYPED